MSDFFLDPDPGMPAVPVHAVDPAGLEAALATLPPAQAAFCRALGFRAGAGRVALLPDPDGVITIALYGLGDKETAEHSALGFGRLANILPANTYRVTGPHPNPTLAAIAIGLGGYQFGNYRSNDPAKVRFVLPDGVDRAEIRRVVRGVTLARDLINTPANDMGPAELAEAARKLAAGHGAAFNTTVGEALLAANLPMIHAVGRAAAAGREPRLIDFTWGDPAHPKVTLVGKGVTFDTGGLDIKSSSAMLLMKKDMGGAANILGLAAMVMDARLPIRLRVLVPAVENAISGEAFRPGDVLKSRKGLSVEIGNTDAEGRLVLGDALTLASEEDPALIIDLATLTGAARVALGPDISPFYTADDALAADLAQASAATEDPLWRMPLWAPYFKLIESRIADINNAGSSTFAGSMTAALFLSRFVGDTSRWLHGDIFGWTPVAKPAKPEGGEAQAIRALYAMLKDRYRR